jgi:hypothetical protein
MKIFTRSRLLRAGVLPVFAVALLAAPAVNAAALHHHVPAQGRPFVQSGAQQDDPALPTFNQPPDYHPDCFDSRLQVPDGSGGLKWVPHLDCRY